MDALHLALQLEQIERRADGRLRLAAGNAGVHRRRQIVEIGVRGHLVASKSADHLLGREGARLLLARGLGGDHPQLAEAGRVEGRVHQPLRRVRLVAHRHRQRAQHLPLQGDVGFDARRGLLGDGLQRFLRGALSAGADDLEADRGQQAERQHAGERDHRGQQHGDAAARHCCTSHCGRLPMNPLAPSGGSRMRESSTTIDGDEQTMAPGGSASNARSSAAQSRASIAASTAGSE